MNISKYYLWLKNDWANTGLILSIFLFVFLIVFVRNDDFVVFIILLQTPLYMIHQTEEYVFPGGFRKFFNKEIFKQDTEDEPLDQNFIFFVNILLIWIVLPVFGLLSTIDYQYGLWIPYFSFFAGIAHILLAVRAKKFYNPGMIVSLVLNIPIGLWSIAYLIDHGILNNFFLNPHIAIGIGVNALLPIMGVILFANYKRKKELKIAPTK
ncbi:MAG: HXXEE domain-containing protein [Chloroflexi bacterium]|nr:HXXEE domain-containing protein [Chloroflexota bacterium]